MQAKEAKVRERFKRLQKRMEEVNREHSDAEVEVDLREATKLLRDRKRKIQNRES